jgi:hypothetical protein
MPPLLLTDADMPPLLLTDVDMPSTRKTGTSINFLAKILLMD